MEQQLIMLAVVVAVLAMTAAKVRPQQAAPAAAAMDLIQ
jgi:hypothetical protein